MQPVMCAPGGPMPLTAWSPWWLDPGIRRPVVQGNGGYPPLHPPLAVPLARCQTPTGTLAVLGAASLALRVQGGGRRGALHTLGALAAALADLAWRGGPSG